MVVGGRSGLVQCVWKNTSVLSVLCSPFYGQATLATYREPLREKMWFNLKKGQPLNI